MAKIYLYPEQVEDYSEKFIARLKEKEYPPEAIQSVLSNHMKRDIIIKYSKKWQDDKLKEMMDMILEVKGGYWAVQELIQQPHVEFEHYRHKGTMCYEKSNVGDRTANRELSEDAYNDYQKGKKIFGETKLLQDNK